MLPKTLGSYGGPFVDESPTKDPTSELAARFGNRFLEDVAQATRTVPQAWVSFVPTVTAAPVTVDAANVTHFTSWGSTSATKPVVAKVADGEYTVTFETEFDDDLVAVSGMESVAETQSVVFTFATCPNVRGLTNGYARVVQLASNVATVTIYDTTDTESDLGGDDIIEFALR